jgi:uncharacterized protein with PIN domain
MSDHPRAQSSEIRFAAEGMLGRLAKMLRLLGYDTLYSPEVSTGELQKIARAGERVILTRGRAEKRFPGLANVFSIRSDNAPEQLREVVQQFDLDTRTDLWTRCTLCNASIQKVEKQAIQSLVEPKVFEIYQEFFRCSGCGHVYWQGSHVERILKNLELILKG